MTGVAGAHVAATKKLRSIAGKITKAGSLLLTGTVYESIKKSNAFQAQMAQASIDAGVPKSWMKALQDNALRVSSRYGVAATDVAKANYRIASSFAGLGKSKPYVEGMVNQATQLAVVLNDASLSLIRIKQDGKGYASGLSLGPGSFFGRVAGRHAATGQAL